MGQIFQINEKQPYQSMFKPYKTRYPLNMVL